MMVYGANSLDLYQFHVDFNNPSNSTFTGPTAISVAAFTPLCNGASDCVPQPTTDNKLDSLADRLMYRLAYRNFGTHESLVVNHSVAVNGGGGVRWYEIQSPGNNPVVAQQGTYAPDASYRWMGSIAMDKVGDIAVGYSVASSSVYPSIAFAGRVPSDPAGELESENLGHGGQRLANSQRHPLGRLQFHVHRSHRRLHVLVHPGVHSDQRRLQLEHAHRELPVLRLQQRRLYRLLSR
jgi:hypothetical protein